MLTSMAVFFSCQVTELLARNVMCSLRGKLCAMKMQAFCTSFKDVIAFLRSLLQIEYGAATLAPECRH